MGLSALIPHPPPEVTAINFATDPRPNFHPAAQDATKLGGHDQDVTAPVVDVARYQQLPGQIPRVALPPGMVVAAAPQRVPASSGRAERRRNKHAARRRARLVRRARLPRRG
jgi:hypothetical protein